MRIFKKNTENKATSKLPMTGKVKKGYRAYCVAVLAMTVVLGTGVTAFAANDPITVVNNLSDFIFGLIRAIGLILLGFGIVQVGLSLKSHDPSQRANGFLTLAGGIIITFAMIKRNKSKNIVFVGNNMTVEKYENLENKNVLFAFFSAAGKKYDGYINSICLNKIEIGRTDGKDVSDKFITSIFAGTKIKVTIDNKMNDYLKTHACAVLPLVFASYRANGNLKLLKKDKAYSLDIMDAIIEGYDVLKKAGYEILPKGEYETCVNKKKFCAWMYRFMFSNFIGKLCISDHAMSAREEFMMLESEFEKLKNETGIETEAYDKLKVDFLHYTR